VSAAARTLQKGEEGGITPREISARRGHSELFAVLEKNRNACMPKKRKNLRGCSRIQKKEITNVEEGGFN